jgi:hypothetical protein
MTIDIITVTGNPVFDYFFTIVFVLGMVAIGPSLLFKLFKF